VKSAHDFASFHGRTVTENSQELFKHSSPLIGCISQNALFFGSSHGFILLISEDVFAASHLYHRQLEFKFFF